MKKYILLSLIALALVACNKPLLKYNPKFEGTWQSEPVYSDGLGDYVADQFTFSGTTGTYFIDCKDTCSTTLCTCLGTIKGAAEVNKQHNMLRLNSQTPRTFVINAEPYEENGSWYFEIDGKKYKKQ